MQITIEHQLNYEYHRPVQLGPQRMQLYPRLMPTQRLIGYRLSIRPEPKSHYLQLDAEGNQVRWVYFEGATSFLKVNLKMTVESLSVNPFGFVIKPFDATAIPLSYEGVLSRLLAPYLNERPASDPVTVWARDLAEGAGHQTVPFLMSIAECLRQDFRYIVREQGPPHPPAETLRKRRGSCRDLSCLMIAACQAMGIAARFVSGYAWAGDEPASHELHAWVEAYLPGAGWRGFDPTQGMAVAEQHIALAASVDPQRAAPVQGAFFGEAASTLKTLVRLDKKTGGIGN